MQIADDERLLPEAQVDPVELRQEQHRHAFEQRRAVLVRGRADGQHEAADVRREVQLASATSSAVGSVALLDAVENAVTIASRIAAEEEQRTHPAEQAHGERVHDELVDRERQHDHADVAPELPQDLVSQLGGEREQQRRDAERREADHEVDQPHA